MIHSRSPVRVLFVIAFLCCLALPSLADVLVVGPGGYSNIQAAVIAASEGDFILVKAGSYNSAVIKSKSLHLFADTGANVKVTNFGVRELAPGQKVVISGFKVGPTTYGSDGIYMTTNRGSVRIENCSISGEDGYEDWDYCDGWHGVWIKDCDDVAMSHCTMYGGEGNTHCPPNNMGWAGNGGHGIYANEDSVVALYHCQCFGGDGGSAIDNCSFSGGSAGSGFMTPKGFLFAAGCIFEGADGGCGADESWTGSGPGNGGNGGHGVYLYGPDAEACLLDNQYEGGQGGPGGYGMTNPDGVPGNDGRSVMEYKGGTAFYLSGKAPSFKLKGPVQELQTKIFTFKGTPGDTIGMFITPVLDSQFLYGLKGQQLFSWSPQPLLVIVGQIPANGTLGKSFQIPDMGPGFETTAMHIQAVFGNASGEVVLGPQQTLIVLDGAY